MLIDIEELISGSGKMVQWLRAEWHFLWSHGKVGLQSAQTQEAFYLGTGIMNTCPVCTVTVIA